MSREKIDFEFQNTAYHVEVEQKGNELILTRDSRTYTVSLLNGTRTGVKLAEKAAAPTSAAAAQAAGPSAGEASSGGSVNGELLSPMTGTIKEIKVQIGAQVQAEQLVVIMEAMKMDIEVYAHKEGTVTEIFLTPGSSVKENQSILKLS